MKFVFYLLFCIYVASSIIFSNYKLNFDILDVVGITISGFIFLLILFLYYKFAMTGKSIFVAMTGSVVLIRALAIFFGLKNDVYNAIKNENYFYIASALLLTWCIFQIIGNRKSNSTH